ncbi:hypothetical protein P261_00134 [Lachnospiraceae bacterium TWA4]|nr:hypothetical protein P261_00134 [Lachnospiraceae bacterium TWA4]
MISELNIHKKVQDLASKLLELKKQQRGLMKSVKKYETELSQIFDAQKVDCLEIEMGLLVRKKIQDGYEWVIEL